MIQQMAWLGLVVEDIDAATQYYTEKLGLTVDEKESMPHVYTQFSLNDGGAVLALVNRDDVKQEFDQSFDTALIVPDADTAYAQFKANGVELLGEPVDAPFGRTFLFRTPDGHILRVLKPPM